MSWTVMRLSTCVQVKLHVRSAIDAEGLRSQRVQMRDAPRVNERNTEKSEEE